MSTLQKLQRAIQACVMRGEAADDYIVKPPNMPAQERLQIYRSAYYLRLIELLENDYSRLATALGKQDFGLLVRDYLACYPSHYDSLHAVGQHLVTFMRDVGRYAKGLIELASIDWLMLRLFLVQHDPVLRLEDFVRIKPEQWAEFKFQLIRAHQVITVHYIDEDLKVHEQALESPMTLMVWRKQGKLFYQKLSPLEIALFKAIKRDLCFAKVCETLLHQFDEAAVMTSVSQRLQHWVGQELFISILYKSISYINF